MFFKATTLTALFALAANGVLAQQNATAQDVALVEANMQQAGLIPGLLSDDEVDLEGTLNVVFGANTITAGQPIAAADVQSAPTVTVMRLTGTDEFETGDLYTAMLVDADVAGTDNSAANQTFHWVANGVSVGADGALDLTASTAAIDYVGPGPLEGTGAHRYVLLLIDQEEDFTAPTGLTFGARSLREYLDTDGLGEVRAANFFTVENGQATVSVQPTTSVDPATVVVAATTAVTTGGSASSSVVTSTGAMTGSMRSSSMMGSASMSASASGAASSAPANGAVGVKATGAWTVGAALVGAAAGALLI